MIDIETLLRSVVVRLVEVRLVEVFALGRSKPLPYRSV